MSTWALAAFVCLLAGGCALLFGQWALAQSRDLVALYWLATGAVTLRASIGFTQKLPP